MSAPGQYLYATAETVFGSLLCLERTSQYFPAFFCLSPLQHFCAFLCLFQVLMPFSLFALVLCMLYINLSSLSAVVASPLLPDIEEASYHDSLSRIIPIK